MNNEIKVNIPEGQKEVKIFTGSAECYQLKGATYNLESTISMINLIKSKSSKQVAMIFYNNDGIKAILDDTVSNRTKDVAQFKFTSSLKLKEWFGILKKSITQKQFVDFLKLRDDAEVDELESIMVNIQKIKIDTKITGEYEDDNGNITFVYKSKDGESMGKIPKLICAKMPIINGGKDFELEFEIELIKPKSEEDKPYFIITCPKFERYWEQAVESEIEVLKLALKDYLILNGSTESR